MRIGAWLAVAVALVVLATSPRSGGGHGGVQAAVLQYNETLAKQLIIHCAAAYTDHPERCPNGLPPSFKVLNWFNDGSIHGVTIFGYVGVDQLTRQIILAFRGSMNALQLIDELTLSQPLPFPGRPDLSVLQYFLMGQQLLSNGTRAAVASLIVGFPSYDVVLTGHSLGGSLATVVALDLVLSGTLKGRSPIVYTYGQPRTGDYLFAQEVQRSIPNLFRVTHYRDMVAHLPPCTSKFDASLFANVCVQMPPVNNTLWTYHHQNEIWYPQEAMPYVFSALPGTFKTCTGRPQGEAASCSNSEIFTTSIDDHRNYFNISVGFYCPESVLILNPTHFA